MTVETATGKKYDAHRCYVTSSDRTLNIGLKDSNIADVALVFGNPVETEVITATEDNKETEFQGYTQLVLISLESSINGVYIALAKK